MASRTASRATDANAAGGATRLEGNDAIEILESDHREIEGLLEALVDAGGEDERVALLEELKALLTIHNASEENLIYPAVRVLAKRRADADELYHQQDEAKVAVWELDMLSEDADDFEARVRKLQSAVLAHIAKEEETEYPRLREAAGPDAMEELTAALRELRGSLHFRPPSAG